MSQKKTDRKGGLGVLDRQDRKTKKPRKFKCVMYNDDFTPMDVVVMILKTVFHKNDVDAITLMLDVHNKGRGIAGVYSREIAETKCVEAIKLAREGGYPFLVKMEAE